MNAGHIGLARLERDGLLDEDMLARAQGRSGQVLMAIGRRRDVDKVDVRVGEQFLDAQRGCSAVNVATERADEEQQMCCDH